MKQFDFHDRYCNCKIIFNFFDDIIREFDVFWVDIVAYF